MRLTDEIRSRLAAAFDPAVIEVVDESERHRGHAGYREGGESHFRVLIRARAFGPMNRLARHRAVHEALGAAIIARVHALTLDVAP